MGSKKKATDPIEKLLKSELSAFIEVTEILMQFDKHSRDKIIDMIKLLYLEETSSDSSRSGSINIPIRRESKSHIA